jgi:SAM-dependent methyltransferase
MSEYPSRTESTDPEPTSQPRLYTSLASWFHLMTAPADYAEEAAFYSNAIRSASSPSARSLLELGSGGGNNASFLKTHFRLTLVDLSPQMIAVSRSINPECEHIVGDMRSVRLGRLFDAVFIHDAVAYMLTEADLAQAIETAYIHCRPGGLALFAPDHVRETFLESTTHGGNDANTIGMRYLEWTWDPNPDDTTYLVDFAYLLRDENGKIRVVSDRHQLGLFARADWLRIIGSVGFDPRAIPFEHSEAAPGSEVFLGLKPA